MTNSPVSLRPGLEALPVSRGYPVPFFVGWPDGPGGEPEFRVADAFKWQRCMRENLCWVCGKVIVGLKVFVLGPMCGINRTTSEPPCHAECARWSARNCPFLNLKMEERRDEEGLMEKLPETRQQAGCPIKHNPGVTLVWGTKKYRPFKVPNGVLIQVGDPEWVEWYHRGREASRSEVLTAVDKGFPKLEAIISVECEKCASFPCKCDVANAIIKEGL